MTAKLKRNFSANQGAQLQSITSGKVPKKNPDLVYRFE
jgi:hypothetical protein